MRRRRLARRGAGRSINGLFDGCSFNRGAGEQAVEARRRTLESRRSCKADTRRKILVGAIVLARVERGEIAEAELRRWLDGAATRSDDRALFNL
jgi:hypothetical protein